MSLDTQARQAITFYAAVLVVGLGALIGAGWIIFEILRIVLDNR